MKKQTYYPIHFAPDKDPDWNINPGVLTGITNMWPTKKGSYRSVYIAPSATGSISTTTYGVPLLGKVVELPDGTAVAITGTTKRLLKSALTSSFAYTDISKGATNYTTSSDWSIVTFGKYILAFSKANTPQVSDSGATFADLGGSPPKASTACVQKNFVLLGDTNDGVDDLGDQVWWSAIGNHANWTPDLGTECGNYRLRDTPGPIRSLVPLRDAVVAYKDNSIYLGRYTGVIGVVWSWECISHNIGCASPHGVAAFGDAHYFIHASNVYRFDGASLSPIGNDVIRYLIDAGTTSNVPVLSTDHHCIDHKEGLIFWMRKTTASGSAALAHGLSYNVFTGKFGWISTPAGDGSTVTGAWYGRVDLLAQTDMFASLELRLTCALVGYGGTTMQTLWGFVDGNSTHTFELGLIGNDVKLTRISKIIPCLSFVGGGQTPTYSNIAVATYRRKSSASSNSNTFSFDSVELKADGVSVARWHKPSFTVTNCDIAGVVIEADQEGEA